MHRPSPEQLSTLKGFERTAFAVADTVNRVPLLKTAAHAYLKTFGAAWVHYGSRHIRHVYGLERLRALTPDRGVLVVSNHRSFFDMYAISCVMLRETSWISGMYFPVRSDYFYERPDGVIVNALMSGMTMYPPVLRDTSRRGFNSYTVDFIADQMNVPGMLCGFHPEGTRNKTADPYTLLAASPGVGQIVHAARPIVIPAFILGLGNNLPKQVLGNLSRTGDPITIAFGEPLDLSAHFSEAP
ncbi:MAG: lysophospholipid acyltransferase family protein, partial [Deltaproteobacteria bacterium]